MPTYPYQCTECGHEFDELQHMTETPLVRCPNCHKDTLVKVMGTGAGIIFKGSGFYLTDYKKEKPKADSPPKKDESKKEEKKEPPSGSSTKETGTKDTA